MDGWRALLPATIAPSPALVAGYGVAVPVAAIAPLLMGLSARSGLRVPLHAARYWGARATTSSTCAGSSPTSSHRCRTSPGW